MKIILMWCVWFRWKELELAKLEPNKTNDKPESAVSRWARAGTKAAKVIINYSLVIHYHH